ncbi:MAG: type II toxin-antitoxin system RelE/ParE family toxin [Hyphomicrobiales bacterium]|nr:type II toxin-antitoxin system RelE/ParE family toxin [Hyphomicrobiales bacterium]
MSQPLVLRLTRAAEADIAEIWAYLAAEASEPVATRVVEKIMDACQLFCHFPLAGASREQFAPGLRLGFAGRYAVYYQHSDHRLVVIRVLHGARDAAALAAGGAFQRPRSL